MRRKRKKNRRRRRKEKKSEKEKIQKEERNCDFPRKSLGSRMELLLTSRARVHAPTTSQEGIAGCLLRSAWVKGYKIEKLQLYLRNLCAC